MMSLNCKLALSTCNKDINEDLFRNYAENDIEAMEISPSFEECEKLDFLSLKRWAEQYNVDLWSFHLPFAPFDKIDISNPNLARQTVKMFKDYINKANDIGIKVFVVHSSGEPIEDSEREDRILCAKNSLKELAEYATEVGCIIAVEDLPRTCLGNCSAEILELISAHKNLRVCFDTNHLLHEEIPVFIKNIGDRIITTHISDYDFINERHWLPGEGSIDWVSVISLLEEVGYDGYWLYEIGLETPWSIERNRELTYTDFRDHYISLMRKEIPYVIGKPKNKLGMWSIMS